MTTIGTFTKTDNGYTGQILTLKLQAKVSIEAAERYADTSPDYRVFADHIEIGAAWVKVSRKKQEYLAVMIDDPTFPAAIHCRLFETEEGSGKYALLWNRK